MGYYKIKNITTDLAKRHNKVNSTQFVEVTSNFIGEKIAITPGNEIFLEAAHLPISVHKLRSEGLVSVIEMDKNTYIKSRAAFESGKKSPSSQVVDNKLVESISDVQDIDSKAKKQQQKLNKKEN